MTWNEFVELQERVGWGEEFSFDYKEEEYWISLNTDGYYLTRSKDSMTQEFDTSEALFEKGKIDGKNLPEIYMYIEW
ncbi:hypothetical protein [Domibacillus aminovorans]|uniref:Uncharacterized protein n=1 Tax=Domibacillus aminovorans TaxID=29332 RepID=A0A177L3F8_9BACI|nr:hypothetical protein [Domibacillus aminovorans]OAH59857.1 hypothetical protein AWH49_18205 [Domibacillus aminovorans]